MPDGAHGRHVDLLLGQAVEKIYLATECEADVKHFCGDVTSGGARIASCVQTHFGEVSGSCRSALASLDAPGDNP